MVVQDRKEEVLKAVLAASVRWLLCEGVQALPGPFENDHHSARRALQRTLEVKFELKALLEIS